MLSLSPLSLSLSLSFSLCPFEIGSHYVSQAGLELLPLPPECWDSRCAAPGPASIISNIPGGRIAEGTRQIYDELFSKAATPFYNPTNN
jgi:hypothetical protein